MLSTLGFDHMILLSCLFFFCHLSLITHNFSFTLSLFPLLSLSCLVPVSQLLLPVAQTLSTQSFYRSKTEESNSSQMSCHITASGKTGVNLPSAMKSFGDLFSLDLGRPVVHLGMRVNTQSKHKSSFVREGHKISMTPRMGHSAWSKLSQL